MQAEPILVEKELLIKAVLELEKHDEIQRFLLLAYIREIRAITEKVEELLHVDRHSHAKILLYRLFLSDSEWINILTNEQIAAWQAEAQNFH